MGWQWVVGMGLWGCLLLNRRGSPELGPRPAALVSSSLATNALGLACCCREYEQGSAGGQQQQQPSSLTSELLQLRGLDQVRKWSCLLSPPLSPALCSCMHA